MNDPNKIKYYAQELIPETYNYLHRAVESYSGKNSFTYIWYQVDDGYYTNEKIS